jgi:hypothetical protein
MARLLGSIVREQEGRLLFRIAAGLADAPQFGFPAGGEFWIKRAQCRRVIEAGDALPGGSSAHDELHVPFELADFHAKALAQGGC